MDLFDLPEYGQRTTVDHHRFHLDAMSFEHAQHLAVAGLAAQFPPVADDEDKFPAGAVALCKVQSCAQDGVIQNVRLPRRSVDWLDDRSSNRCSVYRRSIGSEWPAQY